MALGAKLIPAVNQCNYLGVTVSEKVMQNIIK